MAYLYGQWDELYPAYQGMNSTTINQKVRADFPNLLPRSKKSVVADVLRQSIEENRGTKKTDIDYCCREWRQQVNGPDKPLKYMEQAGLGGMQEKDDLDSLDAFRKDCYAVYDEAEKAATKDKEKKTPGDGLKEYEGEKHDNDCDACGKGMTYRGGVGGQGVCGDCEKNAAQARGEDFVPGEHADQAREDAGQDPKGEGEKGEPKPPLAPPQDYLEWSRYVRSVCERRKADGQDLDDWSMRPTLDGLALINAGCPPDGVKDAAVMHFPNDARQECGMKSQFDFTAFGIVDYLDKAITARVPEANGKRMVPIMLVGPKGTGKTTHAQLLAERLGVPFGMISCNAGVSPSAFFGKQSLKGDSDVIESELCKIYREGGVWLFDEIDAMDANIALAVNASLSNGFLANPVSQEKIPRHENYVPIAAANTLGLGADRNYTGRERLDAATLDRWGCGRVRVTLDTELETKLAEGMIA